jgi:multidrug efflux pump
MNLSAPFVRRPIATVLLTAGLALVGIGAFFVLPVAPLPQVDFPFVSVSANLPGASPETIATSVVTPLERHLGVIAGVNEMTSTSSTNQGRIGLQFDLSRNVDSAAREVQAAINAARVDLPATLRSNPSYQKANTNNAPLMILALSSPTRTPGQIYDAVSNIVSQRLSQVQGIADVELAGSSLPAVRVELLPYALNRYGLSMEDVRSAIQGTNINGPHGMIQGGGRNLPIYVRSDTAQGGRDAGDYRTLIVGYRNQTAIRLQDVAQVVDGVEDVNNLGLFNGRPAVVVNLRQQAGANVIEAVDSVRALLPQLQAQLPPDITLQVASDSTNSIRASLREVEVTLLISIALVVLVVGIFIRSVRATLVPAVATVVSLLATFGVMYLLGFSLNNISLMALTVATGFVVDDAIVVLENTARHIEDGLNRFDAALLGAREVGFTVLSISLSLVAVFLPLFFINSQIGLMLRQFAITLSAAVMISLLISLTTTPMLCALLLAPGGTAGANAPPRRGMAYYVDHYFERGFDWLLRVYAHCLDWALGSRLLVMLSLVFVIGLNVYLFSAIRQGGFPIQDTGQIQSGMRADQSISFQAMQGKLQRLVDIVRRDPAVATVVGSVGGRAANNGNMFINLKPASQRDVTGQAVIARLRPKLARVTGVAVSLNAVQDLRTGGRASTATYQYTLKSDNQADLKRWAGKLADALKSQPALTDVDTDQADNGVETYVAVDKDSASRLGLAMRDIDNALYDSFGQRQVATIYDALNQYHVIMEVAREYARSPNALRDLYVPSTGLPAPSAANPGGTEVASAAAPSGTGASAAFSTTGTATSAGSTVAMGSTTSAGSTASPASTATAAAIAAAASATPANVAAPAVRDASAGSPLSLSTTTMVPLATIASVSERAAATSVSHQDAELATTVTFNLAEGYSLSDAATAIAQTEAAIHMPINVRGSFQGSARAAQDSNKQLPLLILAALTVIYIVLGILYESLVHPLTVLSTLPSAGVGAFLALLICHMEFSTISLIGILLLIGIVKKNAILIIDFALEAERSRGLTAVEAVREACLLRFRPIMMTTLAAGLGALPLAIGFGEGYELRQPLGVSIIGGLIVSQVLTLLTTPVVYILLDKLRSRSPDERRLSRIHAEMTGVSR